MFLQIKEMLTEKFGEEEITMETNIKEDLDADSLDIVELIMELEEAFEITVEEEDAQKLQTVADIVKYIENAKK